MLPRRHGRSITTVLPLLALLGLAQGVYADSHGDRALRRSRTRGAHEERQIGVDIGLLSLDVQLLGSSTSTISSSSAASDSTASPLSTFTPLSASSSSAVPQIANFPSIVTITSSVTASSSTTEAATSTSTGPAFISDFPLVGVEAVSSSSDAGSTGGAVRASTPSKSRNIPSSHIFQSSNPPKFVLSFFSSTFNSPLSSTFALIGRIARALDQIDRQLSFPMAEARVVPRNPSKADLERRQEPVPSAGTPPAGTGTPPVQAIPSPAVPGSVTLPAAATISPPVVESKSEPPPGGLSSSISINAPLPPPSSITPPTSSVIPAAPLTPSQAPVGAPASSVVTLPPGPAATTTPVVDPLFSDEGFSVPPRQTSDGPSLAADPSWRFQAPGTSTLITSVAIGGPTTILAPVVPSSSTAAPPSNTLIAPGQSTSSGVGAIAATTSNELPGVFSATGVVPGPPASSTGIVVSISITSIQLSTSSIAPAGPTSSSSQPLLPPLPGTSSAAISISSAGSGPPDTLRNAIPSISISTTGGIPPHTTSATSILPIVPSSQTSSKLIPPASAGSSLSGQFLDTLPPSSTLSSIPSSSLTLPLVSKSSSLLPPNFNSPTSSGSLQINPVQNSKTDSVPLGQSSTTSSAAAPTSQISNVGASSTLPNSEAPTSSRALIEVSVSIAPIFSLASVSTNTVAPVTLSFSATSSIAAFPSVFVPVSSIVRPVIPEAQEPSSASSALPLITPTPSSTTLSVDDRPPTTLLPAQSDAESTPVAPIPVLSSTPVVSSVSAPPQAFPTTFVPIEASASASSSGFAGQDEPSSFRPIDQPTSSTPLLQPSSSSAPPPFLESLISSIVEPFRPISSITPSSTLQQWPSEATSSSTAGIPQAESSKSVESSSEDVPARPTVSAISSSFSLAEPAVTSRPIELSESSSRQASSTSEALARPSVSEIEISSVSIAANRPTESVAPQSSSSSSPVSILPAASASASSAAPSASSEVYSAPPASSFSPSSSSSKEDIYVPTQTWLIVAPTSASASATSAPATTSKPESQSGPSTTVQLPTTALIPNSVPTLIVPANSAANKENAGSGTEEDPIKDTVLISLLLAADQYPWTFVVKSADATSQLFNTFPRLISAALEVSEDQVQTYGLQVYQPASWTGDQAALLTQWLAYIPDGKFDTLNAYLKASNSPLFNQTGIQGELAAQINTAFPLAANSETAPATTSTLDADGSDIRTRDIIIGVCVGIGGLLWLALVVWIYKRVKRHNDRAVHRRLSEHMSMFDDREREQRRYSAAAPSLAPSDIDGRPSSFYASPIENDPAYRRQQRRSLDGADSAEYHGSFGGSGGSGEQSPTYHPSVFGTSWFANPHGQGARASDGGEMRQVPAQNPFEDIVTRSYLQTSGSSNGGINSMAQRRSAAPGRPVQKAMIGQPTLHASSLEFREQ